jgi:hypothetical protein
MVAMLGIDPNYRLSVSGFRGRGQRKSKEHTDSQDPVSHNGFHGRFSLIQIDQLNHWLSLIPSRFPSLHRNKVSFQATIKLSL